MKRTAFLAGGAALAVAAFTLQGHALAAYEVQHSDDQWRKLLGNDRFEILRRGGTEPPYTSPLNGEKRPGLYACAGCDLALFKSEWKYDAGEGWPSFYTVLPKATKTKDDYELIEKRTEVHCARCGGHLGHIFDDGPAPTHLRYCIDGLALTFKSQRSS